MSSHAVELTHSPGITKLISTLFVFVDFELGVLIVNPIAFSSFFFLFSRPIVFYPAIPLRVLNSARLSSPLSGNRLQFSTG